MSLPYVVAYYERSEKNWIDELQCIARYRQKACFLHAPRIWGLSQEFSQPADLRYLIPGWMLFVPSRSIHVLYIHVTPPRGMSRLVWTPLKLVPPPRIFLKYLDPP